ncbi:MAG: hypothetical protein KGI26_02035, partial [Thaumarchaeota archaeon]|nr:hypothetical protein [Nitrososphaerota archaeon]
MASTSRKYIGRDCDLLRLATAIEEYFETRGYRTQSGRRESSHVVQARKENALRAVVAADRSFTLTL